MSAPLYDTVIPGAAHWSLTIPRGRAIRLTDIAGGGNVGMLFYNPRNLLERYNAPDTLKCQHTFKLTAGHCLYSDMGRIFCSITQDSLGWHDTVGGNSTRAMVAKRWGEQRYQEARNDRFQSGADSFLIEAAKYGMGRRDLAANVNWFSRLVPDDEGNLAFDPANSPPGSSVTLRFEMETLVLLHSCAHPMDSAAEFPRQPIRVELLSAPPVAPDDLCLNACAENGRGFENNRLYHLAG